MTRVLSIVVLTVSAVLLGMALVAAGAKTAAQGESHQKAAAGLPEIQLTKPGQVPEEPMTMMQKVAPMMEKKGKEGAPGVAMTK